MGRSPSDTAPRGTVVLGQPGLHTCCPCPTSNQALERSVVLNKHLSQGGTGTAEEQLSPATHLLIINEGNLNYLSWRNTKLKWHTCIGLWGRRFLATSHIRFSSPLLFKSNQCAFIPAHVSISLWQSAKFLTSAMSELWYFLPLVDLVNIFFITLISFFIKLHYNIHILQDTWVLQQAPAALCGYAIAHKH